ncbi:hypothetical protein RhiirA1_536813 [Rhizophagus irregularis]|uniref:Uncharacterized protein n=1 Tax=Rhizophagus irregularis TaxID=588596 RepID=A0A2N0RNA4_9GLOM|nr:hypothetical protein RhiirA1_536813 [Rhizophagus irregularis]
MLSSNKHLGNNQISRTSEDTIFRYYEDTDMLSIYLLTYTILPSFSSVVSYSHEANNYNDNDDKIVSVDIYEASELLCCRLFETSETIDNKPPFAFYPEDRDEVEVLFVGSKPLPITFEKTENKDFEVGINDEKLCYFTMQVADCLKRYRRRREKNLRKKRG